MAELHEMPDDRARCQGAESGCDLQSAGGGESGCESKGAGGGAPGCPAEGAPDCVSHGAPARLEGAGPDRADRERLLSVGLTEEDVRERIASGQVNADADVRTRSIPAIVRDNICTLFNLINIILAVAIFTTGVYRNLLFMAIVGFNVAIGVFQEVKSKLAIDRLRVITSTKAHALREGTFADIPLDQVVLGEVIKLGRGDQVPSDCVVLSGECAANESLLTGESDLVAKREGSALFSGSFISSGSCVAQVTAVGADNYATRINNAAKAHRPVVSGIMDALKTIVRFSAMLIVPLGALLMAKETVLAGAPLSRELVNSAILHTSAALVGMIPQGLILLTSAVLAVSVVRLARHRVLVQELYCVETLARVDVICLDKTGTITTGEMDVDELAAFGPATEGEALRALALLDASADPDEANETARAIRAYVGERGARAAVASDGEAGAAAAAVAEAGTLGAAAAEAAAAGAGAAGVGATVTEAGAGASAVEAEAAGAPAGRMRAIPFSSERKYSGVQAGAEAYCMGAAEFVLRDRPELALVKERIDRTAGVRRVLVVARVDGFSDAGAIEGGVRVLGLLYIRDRVRETAPQTLSYFAEQGVRVNIISGDSMETVSNIAASVGVIGAERRVDMSTVRTEEELARAARECRVFGRVTPDQKRQLVEALKAQGHTVAMTGDGVNDVLALHAADCSVAMGSGSDAARSVANLVLLDNDFASMPHVVAEGRRSINNLQRSAALFLVKTVFSVFLAVAFILISGYAYPFVTIQLALIDLFTVGIPSFVLALEPNRERVRGDFLRNALTKALPGASMVVLSILIANVAARVHGFGQAEFSTMCVVLTCIVGINLVARLSIPLTPVRAALLAVVVAGPVFGIFVVPGAFLLVPLTGWACVVCAILGLVVTVAFQLLFSYAQRHEDAYLARLEQQREAA